MTSANLLGKAIDAMHITSLLHGMRRLSLVFLLATPLAVFAAEQRAFATPDEAVDALVAALKADDDAALVAIFGDKHKALVVTPDKAANSQGRATAAAQL